MKQPGFGSKHKAMASRFFIFLSCIGLISACNKEDSGVNMQATASVSVYALVPDAPQMNFFINEANVAASVPFGSFTLYNHIVPGTITLKAQTTSLKSLIDTSFLVTADHYYSLFLTGSFAGIRPVVIPDSLGALNKGSVNLRFLVLSPGVANIDFFAVKDSVNTYTWKNRSFTDNIANDSINRFIKFSTGTYSFYAVKTNSTDTLAKFRNRSISDSSNYTIMLEGLYDKAANDTTLLLGSRQH